MKRQTGETVTVEVKPGGAAPSPSGRAPELAEVDLPSRFRPVRVLGAGAMGYVVEAHDESLGRDIAVKVIAAKRIHDPKSRDRFLREARAVAALRHENIVTIHDLDPRGKFLVMELVRGETLKERIARDGARGADEARRIGRALLGALAAAHAAGVTHRDVKPANVLLGADGGVKLADFGVAATTDSELTATGEVIGTPAYMAPEQLRGHGSDPVVDIYAAGATLFEVATGRRLHEPGTRTSDVTHKVLSAIEDRALAAAIERAVRDDPRERFPDAAAFARALDAKAPPRRRRAPWIVAGLAVATVAGTALAIATHASTTTPAERLARGVAALERQDYRTAEPALRAAAATHPEAHYHLAVLAWWSSRPTDEVLGAIDAALAAGVDERLAAVARGLRALVTLEYPGVVDTFGELATRYPNDRDVLYGWFEALFHSGQPAKAAAIYQQLRAAAPDLGLGRHHVLAYWINRGELDRAREALRGATGPELVKWQARIDVAAGDFARAIGRLEGETATDLRWELAATYAAGGRADDAHAVAVKLAGDMRASAIPLLAIALARGTTTGPEAVSSLWKVALNAANVPPSLHVSQRDAWVELASLIAIDGDGERARTALPNLPRDLETKMLEAAVARVLLHAIVDDRAALTRLATSAFPEVSAIAEAALAEASGARDAAVAAWRRALAADGSGRFRIVELVRLAQAQAAAGDRDGAAATCALAVRPRLFHWSWGAAVPACAALTAGRTPP